MKTFGDWRQRGLVSFCHNFTIMPYSILDRKLLSIQTTLCISLEILYRGDVELTQTNALNVFEGK